MHGQERRRLATGTLTEFDHSYAGTIAELGYPTRSAPRTWRDGHEGTGEVPAGRFATNPRYAAGTGGPGLTRRGDGRPVAARRVRVAARGRPQAARPDRGSRHRRPGRVGICEADGLAGSMSRKGCSPDNARCLYAA